MIIWWRSVTVIDSFCWNLRNFIDNFIHDSRVGQTEVLRIRSERRRLEFRLARPFFYLKKLWLDPIKTVKETTENRGYVSNVIFVRATDYPLEWTSSRDCLEIWAGVYLVSFYFHRFYRTLNKIHKKYPYLKHKVCTFTKSRLIRWIYWCL